MRYLYTTLLYLLVPFVIVRLLFLGIKTPAYWKRWGERFGFFPVSEFISPVIWIHAVSVGEVEAAVPLANRLRKEFPLNQLVLTTVTPTGAATVRKRHADNILHFYLPYDLPFAVLRILRFLRPVICIIMETEVWPNLFHYCRMQKIPVILVNARLSEKSFGGYKKLASLTVNTLNCVDRIVAQSEKDAERFIALGYEKPKICVAGNLKFDIEIESGLRERAHKLRQKLFPNRTIWIAASTHAGEEELVLDAYESVLSQHSNFLLIIAPRHPQRFEKVSRICVDRGFSVVSRSSSESCDLHTQVLLLDSLGELLLFYACADIAYVGGSLVPSGGHNMLEPACVGIPIISGHHVDNFREISTKLEVARAAFIVRNTQELEEKILELLDNAELRRTTTENGLKVVAENRGGTASTLKIIGEFIN